ncbi:uncharacterized protein [Paramisgurnus dabryanus]|uniref:uncharacterized protein n=1 Tax=Paramisgurnus dabryanus TaxID=90735 RepID=UPI0031F3E785
MAVRKKARHWTREETLALISVWSEPTFQFQFEHCVHNHKVWHEIWKKVCQVCPSIQNTFDSMKCKDRIEYLKRLYRDCVKHNNKTGSDPQRCPYYDELDSVLACRPMTNPGDGHMDMSSSDEQEHSSSSADTSGVSDNVPDQPAAAVTASENNSSVMSQQTSNRGQNPTTTSRKRKGKKTQIMEAMERGINMLIQHDKDATEQRQDKDQMAWERQFQQARLDLERARFEFEVKRQEAEDRRARDTQQFMLQLMQMIRPTVPQYQPPTSFTQYLGQQYYPSDSFCVQSEAVQPNPSLTQFHEQRSLSDQSHDK